MVTATLKFIFDLFFFNRSSTHIVSDLTAVCTQFRDRCRFTITLILHFYHPTPICSIISVTVIRTSLVSKYNVFLVLQGLCIYIVVLYSHKHIYRWIGLIFIVPIKENCYHNHYGDSRVIINVVRNISNNFAVKNLLNSIHRVNPLPLQKYLSTLLG